MSFDEFIVVSKIIYIMLFHDVSSKPIIITLCNLGNYYIYKI